MTNNIEKIVRPFQDGRVFDARVIAPDQPAVAVPDNVVIEWGGQAETNYQEEPPPYTMGFTATWDEDPSRRVTETVRVENPDDASQFVDVERIKSTVFKNSNDGSELPLKLNWS